MGRCEDLGFGFLSPLGGLLPNLNCTLLWQRFEQTFIGKDPLSIAEADYQPFFLAASHPVNRVMFWTGSDRLQRETAVDENSTMVTSFPDFDLVHDMSNGGEHFWTLEDTLWGYLLNGLIWCGANLDQQSYTYFNYTYCPSYGAPGSRITFWNAASRFFAQRAMGDVWMIGRGSIRNGQPYEIFRSPALGNYNTSAGIFPSIFATVELPSINIASITSFTVWIISNPDVPDESCASSQGSVQALRNALMVAGVAQSKITCEDDPPVVQFFRCADSLSSAVQSSAIACEFDPNNPFVVTQETESSKLGPAGSVAALVIILCLFVGVVAFLGGRYYAMRSIKSLATHTTGDSSSSELDGSREIRKTGSSMGGLHT